MGCKHPWALTQYTTIRVIGTDSPVHQLRRRRRGAVSARTTTRLPPWHWEGARRRRRSRCSSPWGRCGDGCPSTSTSQKRPSLETPMTHQVTPVLYVYERWIASYPGLPQAHNSTSALNCVLVESLGTRLVRVQMYMYERWIASFPGLSVQTKVWERG